MPTSKWSIHFVQNFNIQLFNGSVDSTAEIYFRCE
jgi:hypothetical protein